MFDADREAAPFLPWAKWVVVPLLVASTVGLLVLAARGSDLIFVAIGGVFALSASWNIFFVVWRRRARRREAERSPIPAALRAVAVVPSGLERDGVGTRLLQGARSMCLPTSVEAATPSGVPEVHAQLARVAEEAGAAWAWHPGPSGVAVEWAVRPPDVQNVIFMRCAGDLRSDGSRTTFAGTVRPDGLMLLGVLPVAVFGVGGVVAIIVGTAGLFVARGDKTVFAFFLMWGAFGATWSVLWIWSHAKAYEVHLDILRAVFGDALVLGRR